MLNHWNGVESTRKKSMQPPSVFIRRQSNKSFGHSGREKKFKMGGKKPSF